MDDRGPGPAPETTVASLEDCPVRVAYALLRLRSEVFVVEQDCPYLDLDGRDLEPTTEHRWAHRPGDPAAVLACLRVLLDPGARRIGRVATAASSRGLGLAGALVAGVVADHGAAVDLVMDAQSHLGGFYARHGFVRDGDDFVEDGIPHTPMRRPRG